MRFTSFVLLVIFCFSCPALFAVPSKNAPAKLNITIATDSQDHTFPDVRFVTKTDEYTTYFTSDGLILAGFTPRGYTQTAEAPQYFEMKLALRNALPDVEVSTLNPRLARSDFFGSDSPNWLTDIPNYAKVKYANVYSDVDMLFQAHEQQLDVRFIIAPGGDPRNIRFQIEGAQNIYLTPEGTLLLTAKDITFVLPKPAGYQMMDESGARQVVDARYFLTAKNEIGFQIAPYDSRRTLLIQP